MKNRIYIIFALIVVLTMPVVAQDLPTMGWSSWNTYHVNISEALIKEQADACVATGLKDAGYRYINIDDGFFGGRDAQTGHLLIHPTRFPNGLKAVADYIHSLGLKAGIYSDAGANTCGCWYDHDSIAQGVGFYGHDEQDAMMYFCEYGFDFIKIDFCGGNPTANSLHLDLDPKERYTAIANAIKATGRTDVRMNVCRWDFPGTWVRDIATSWRMSADISCRWSKVKDIIEQNMYLSAYAGDGHYNDMDMLEVGRSLSDEEDRTHFGMWCMMSSPLLIGCDMTTIRPATLALLKNDELIAIDQDPLGLQAYCVKHSDGTYVVAKDLLQRHADTRAVALYNPTDTAKVVSVSLAELELAGSITLRDVFAHQDVMVAKGATDIHAKVPAHGTVIYRVTASERLERNVYEAETAYLSAYQELYNELAVGTAYYCADDACSGGMKVANLGFRPDNDLQWRDVYSREGGAYVMKIQTRAFPSDAMVFVAVNGDDVKQIKADDADADTITMTVQLQKGSNTIRLSNSKGPMPEIDKMEIHACPDTPSR